MEFNNVKLVAKANVYDGGKVNSRTFYLESGERKTLGFMLAGEYEFGVGAAEVMEILSGSMEALLPGESEYQTFGPGSSFSLPADCRYQVRVAEFADYLCAYAG